MCQQSFLSSSSFLILWRNASDFSKKRKLGIKIFTKMKLIRTQLVRNISLISIKKGVHFVHVLYVIYAESTIFHTVALYLQIEQQCFKKEIQRESLLVN